MHASFDAAPIPFDWQRVAALCTTFATHLVAIALIAAPLAIPLTREMPKPIAATLIPMEPPPALPPPPEPAPPPRAPVIRHTIPTPAPPPPIASAPIPAPTALPAPTTSAPAPTASAPIATGNSDIGPASPGETRTLAYDGALRLTYPPASLRAREQGSVLLRVLVDEHGAPQRIEIARSSGHPKLDSAAREAVRNARFRPVLRAGHPVPAWGLVPIEFRLDRA